MSVDWAQVRREFPALENWTYLNTATYGQAPRRAGAAMAGHMAHRDELACGDFLDWFDDADRLRATVARLIGSRPDDIAFTGGAAIALSMLLGGLDWREGDRVVTLENEFPNNLYAPHFAGAGVELVETPWSGFYDAITDRTRLVLMSMLNYSNGFRPPLEEIGAYLRERGVLFYVDGTQGVGALRMDVARVRPSMLAVHGYKWLMSPTGAGFMYVDPELRRVLRPSIVGWRSDKNWRRVDNLHHGRPEFTEAAERYEGGMIPFALLYAMEQSMELILEIGPDAIEQRVLELADQLRATIRSCGGTALEGVTPIVAGRFDGADVSALAKQLRTRRVLVSARHGHLRVSPHLYNDETDVERFHKELRALL